MASLLLVRRPLSVGLGLTAGLSAHSYLQFQTSRPMRCDSTTEKVAGAFRTYSKEAKTPVVKNGKVNTATYKQISSGSILGLLGGVVVSTFSKPLAFLIGLLIFGAQYMETKGIHLLPTKRIQGYVQNINLRSAIEDNVAFKLSFGATFMLAAFAEF